MKKQWKGFVSGILATIMVLGLGGAALAVQKQATLDYPGIKITLDGKAVVPKDAAGNAVEPFSIDGATYLPVRGIASAMGLDVAWDAATQTVKMTTPGKAPAEKPTETPATNETTAQKNAIAKAKTYLKVSAFSYQGLIVQLEYEKFSHEDAVYGADNCGADWNEQAAKKAKSYLDISAFSRDSLITQLEYEKFTHEQAVYGAEQSGY